MSDKITFYNCLEDVAKLHGFDTPSQAEQYGGEVDMYFIIVSEAAELYATSQYNKALEDVKSKVQGIQSNSSDNDDEWFALQSVLEQIEIIQLKK